MLLSVAFSNKQISNDQLQNLMEERIDGLIYQRVSDSNLGDLFVLRQAKTGKNYFLQKFYPGGKPAGVGKGAKWLESIL